MQEEPRVPRGQGRRATGRSRAGLTEVAFDPQTSGGLLIALPAKAAGRLISKLHAQGIGAATIVGRACPRRDAWVYLD